MKQWSEVVATDVCPTCKGAGFVRRDVPIGHPDFGRPIACTCQQAAKEQVRKERLLRLSNLGPLSRMTFETFKPDGYGLRAAPRRSLQIAYQTAQQFANNPDGWLVLVGGYGCGKTHLAAAIANTCLVRGDAVLFVIVPDLLDHLRAAFSPGSATSYDQRFEEVRDAKLLILDDLGTQNATPWAQEKLFQILNHRYNAQLPTVITTNNEWEEIDVRIRSRMVDPHLSSIVTIQAPDFRRVGVDDDKGSLSSLPLLNRMTFDTFSLRTDELSTTLAEDLKRTVQIARKFAVDPVGWLVFTGDFGCGKTHLAAAIANYRVHEGEQPLFVVVPDLLDYLRASFGPQSAISYDKRFDMVRNATLLVLDDLGTQSATPWAREKLYQIFNHRYNAQLPTVITMNQIEGTDARLMARMLEMQSLGRGTIRHIKAPTYRGSGAQKQATSSGRTARRRTGRK